MLPVPPTTSGTVERAGAALHYHVYERDDVRERGAPTIALLPTWEIVDSRAWKMQVPYLSRHFRVVTYDAAGTGHSSGPRDSSRYTQANRLDDAVAILRETCPDGAVIAGVSSGGRLAHCVQAFAPDLVRGVVSIGCGDPWVFEPPTRPDDAYAEYDPVTNPRPEGWRKVDPAYMRADYDDFLAFFLPQVASEPHSEMGIEDLTAWAKESDPFVLASAVTDDFDLPADEWRERLAHTDIPSLIIHGTEDRHVVVDSARRAHDLIARSELWVIEGAGHVPNARFPVLVNHRIRAFAEQCTSGESMAADTSPGTPGLSSLAASANAAPSAVAASAHAGPRRGPRVLYLSSPIGLGHARRDLAIADELRARHPEATVEWLAQDPVTRVLAANGELVHPASAALASESAHIESECDDHHLAAFQALRTMDAILTYNFGVFDDLLAQERFDLVIADEAWDVDYHLFENPNLKKAPMAWMTDFVGTLPMPSRGEREVFLAADHNLEMLEHVERHPDLRDGAIFVGGPDDVVDADFGPGLPGIRDWTAAHFDFSGYITGFDPRALGSREQLRAELGYRGDERVCIVSVGGSGVGGALIRRIVSAAGEIRRAVPDLRIVVVTGPRLDPAAMPQVAGVEYRAFVPDLHRHLAACDIAIVQGGLTTTMELTAAKVPFIYVPLRDHFEQNFHVRARLDRYRAGRCMDFDELTPEALAAAVAEELRRPVDYRDVETDGAARAAELIGALL